VRHGDVVEIVRCPSLASDRYGPVLDCSEDRDGTRRDRVVLE
jgi:hypothetical protein